MKAFYARKALTTYDWLLINADEPFYIIFRTSKFSKMLSY